MNAVSKNIKKLRKKYGFTQEELAQKLHVTRQAVSNWETESNQPDIEMLIRIAEVFGTDVNALIYGERPEPYPRFQRRYVFFLAGCGAALVIFLALEIFLRPYLLEIRNQRYITIPFILYVLTVYPLIEAVLGAAFPAILSLWADIRLKAPAKWIAIALGIACMLPAVLVIVPNPWNIALLTNDLLKILRHTLSVLCGTGIFLGLNR